MTICSLFCFILAAALMITSLDKRWRSAASDDGLDASPAPVEFAFSARRH
jgi:hypothetical protein